MAKISSSPWSAVGGVVTFILSIWGLWEMCHKIKASYGDFWALAAVGLIVVGVLLPFAISTFVKSGLRRFSFPAEERYLITRVARTWRIASDGSASVETEGSYLFFREPRDEDLFDVAFSSEDYDLGFYQLQSPDAVARDQQLLGSNLWKVFWRPKTAIEIAKPYLHKFTAAFPAPNGGFTSKSFTIQVSALTMQYQLDIESELPVWRSYAYKKRWWQRLRDHGQIVRTAQRIKRTHAPPVTRLNEKKLSFAFQNLGRADTYYVVLLYKPETSEKLGDGEKQPPIHEETNTMENRRTSAASYPAAGAAGCVAGSAASRSTTIICCTRRHERE